MSTQTVGVLGMTCHHCVKSVTEEVSAIPGVTEVAVDLNVGGTSQVTITAEAPVADDQIAEAVQEAGYALASPGNLL